jgi:hypothetical protein
MMMTMGKSKAFTAALAAAVLLLLAPPNSMVAASRTQSYHSAGLPKPRTSLDGHVVAAKMRQVLRDQMLDPAVAGGSAADRSAAAAEAAATALDGPSQPGSTRNEWPTYLSAAVVITLGPVDGVMDSARQAMLSMAVTLFLEKIFGAQDKYDLSLRSVGVIEQGLSIVGEGGAQINRAKEGGNRNLRRSISSGRHLSSKNMAVEVESVITAQYYRTDGSSPTISTEQFAEMLKHVFDKFEVNLVDILKEQESGEDWKRRTPYFESVQFASIAVRTGGSAKGHMPGGVGVEASSTGGSGDTSKAVGIAALLLSGIAILSMSLIVYR